MMHKRLFTLGALLVACQLFAQTNPAITSWIINTDGSTGRHYVAGSGTTIPDTALTNVRWVQYSANYCYIKSSGIPSYPVGPYQDGNPSLATGRNWIFKIPLNPVQNTATLTNVGMGQIGVFINGVPMYNYADGMSYNNAGVWHRDAVYFERDGFDCAKGHPSPVFSGGAPGQGTLIGGSYHHHQNPSAFNLDAAVVSDVCDVYASDGLYVMNPAEHSPLLGFAFDGFPVYGAYGYANPDGTGGIARIRSSYQYRNITTRTTLPNGTNASSAGPAVNAQYPIGCFMEDYEYVAGSGDLDEHNGRFCITPEYPAGIYCYFTTVDAQQNSFYPYILGPTYYGTVVNANFPSPGGGQSTNVTINEPVTNYTPTLVKEAAKAPQLLVFPNPADELVAMQVGNVFQGKVLLEMFDTSGRKLMQTTVNAGSSMGYFNTSTLYNGEYILRASQGTLHTETKVLVQH